MTGNPLRADLLTNKRWATQPANKQTPLFQTQLARQHVRFAYWVVVLWETIENRRYHQTTDAQLLRLQTSGSHIYPIALICHCLQPSRASKKLCRRNYTNLTYSRTPPPAMTSPSQQPKPPFDGTALPQEVKGLLRDRQPGKILIGRDTTRQNTSGDSEYCVLAIPGDGKGSVNPNKIWICNVIEKSAEIGDKASRSIVTMLSETRWEQTTALLIHEQELDSDGVFWWAGNYIAGDELPAARIARANPDKTAILETMFRETLSVAHQGAETGGDPHETHQMNIVYLLEDSMTDPDIKPVRRIDGQQERFY